MSQKHIATFLRRLGFIDGDILQVMGRNYLRAPHRVDAGLFSTLEAAAEACMDISQSHGNVGMIRNPIAPNNRTVSAHGVTNELRHGDAIKPCAGGRVVSLESVVMAIDIDCIKTEDHMSASDEELEAASYVMRAVERYLTSLGFPSPAILRTGSGYHMYYRMERSANPTTASYFMLLCHLRDKFSNESAKIDISTSSDTMQLRIPYTFSYKGSANAARPHRQIEIISIPKAMETVSLDLINKCNDLYEPLPDAKVKAWRGSTVKDEDSDFYFLRASDVFEDNVVIDAEGMLDLITFIEEQDGAEVSLLNQHKKDDGTDVFYLASCPIKGARHIKQDEGKTVIMIFHDEKGRRSLGFNCFAEACAEATFRDALDKMLEPIGMTLAEVEAALTEKRQEDDEDAPPFQVWKTEQHVGELIAGVDFVNEIVPKQYDAPAPMESIDEVETFIEAQITQYEETMEVTAEIIPAVKNTVEPNVEPMTLESYLDTANDDKVITPAEARSMIAMLLSLTPEQEALITESEEKLQAVGILPIDALRRQVLNLHETKFIKQGAAGLAQLAKIRSTTDREFLGELLNSKNVDELLWVDAPEERPAPRRRHAPVKSKDAAYLDRDARAVALREKIRTGDIPA